MSDAFQFGFDFERQDITAHRHHGNLFSVEAHERVRRYKTPTRNRIEAMIRQRDPAGMTSEEIARELGAPGHPAPKNAFSGRLSELKAMELVYVAGTREHCGVLVHRDHRGHT
jgi:hypothetical protein